MATPVGQLTIEMAANIVRLQKDMEGARKTVDGAMDSITKSVNAAMNTISGLFAGVSIGAFAGKLISVEREFGTLNASLITVTGSANAADKAFAMLEQFASTTPFSLKEVTAAFIKLSAMGLDPSAEALRSYGNTASAMGKSLNQMIEAVADAATGEFERLKEFGIKAKSEGDRVTFTFKGVSTNIGKNAEEIEGYLRRIGDVDFASAMELRSKTLDGAISNLGDSFDTLFRTINDELTGDVLLAAVKKTESAIVNLQSAVKNFADFIEDNKISLMLVGAILAAPSLVTGIYATVAAFVALRVAVIGLTAAFVSNPIALAILAITAAAIPAIDGIQRYMNANKDLEKEQAALNQTQAENERLLRQAEPVKAASVVSTKVLTEAEKEREKELKKQNDTYTKLINDIEDKTGAMLLEQQGTEKLSESQKLALKIMQDIQTGTLKLNDAQKIKITQSLEDMLRTAALNEEMKKQQESYSKVTKEINSKSLALAEEDEQTAKLSDSQKLALKIMQDIQSGTLTLNAAQKIKITQDLEELLNTEQLITKKKDLASTQAAAIALSNKLNDEQDKQTESLRENVIKLMEQNEELRDGKEAMMARQIAVMRSTATDLEFQAANEGGNRALEEQARLLRQQADLAEDNALLTAAKEAEEAFKKTSDSIAESLTDALMRGFESGKDFGKNLMASLVNMFKTLVLRPIIQPIAQGGANFILSMMGMGATGSAAAGQGMTIAGINFAAQGSALADGFISGVSGMFSGGAPVTSMGGAASGAFNAGSSAAMAMPYVAAALVALNALGAFRSNKVVGGGLTGTLGEGDITSYDLQRRSGTLFSGPDYSMVNMQTSEMSKNLQTAFKGMRDSAVAMGQMLGKSTTAVETFTMAIGDVKVHPDIATLGLALDGLTEEGKAAKIEAALAAANEGMAQLVLGATSLQKVGETAYEALTRLADIQAISESLNLFGGAFTTFATASVAARESIINLAGGLDALIAKTQGFVANFYSKEEQAGITARGIVTALEVAGFTASQIAALDTRADFRTLLENIDVSTVIGQKQFVALLDLQAAYSATVPIMEEQSATLLEIAEAAPQIEILQKMFETDAAYQARVVEAELAAQVVFNDMLVTMGKVDISIETLTTIMAGKLDRLATEMAAAQAQANAAAASAIAMANASSAAAIASATAALAAAASSNNVEVAAMGGFISGPTLVGEHGPELFDPRNSQIYTAPATSNIFGGNEVAGEIRALRDEVAMMRYETRSTAVNTAKIFRLQDNWDVRGLTVKTDVDQPLDTVTV